MESNRLFSPLQTAQSVLLLAIATGLAIAIVELPPLRNWSLAILGLVMILLSLQRMRGQGKYPDLVLASMLLFFSLILGITGGLSSPLLPLVYLAFFVVTLFSRQAQAISASILLILALWATTDHTQIDLQQWVVLLSLLAVFPLQILSLEMIKAWKIADQVANSSSEDAGQLRLFLNTFVIPKLEVITQLAQHPQENAETIERQLSHLSEEISDAVQE